MSTSTLETSTLTASTPPTEAGSFLSRAINATKAAAHITSEEIEEKKVAAYDLLRYSKGPGGVEGVDASDGVDDQEAFKLREAAEPPEIRYTHNVVLDMAGYHSKSQTGEQSESATESEGRESLFHYLFFILLTMNHYKSIIAPELRRYHSKSKAQSNGTLLLWVLILNQSPD